MTEEEVLKFYFPDSLKFHLEKKGEGAINLTYKVTVMGEDEKREYILQRMAPIFSPLLMEDIEAVTLHLTSKGLKTQRVVKTKENKNYVRGEKSWWRLLWCVPGRIFSEVLAAEQAKEAAAFAGRFQEALFDCEHEFKHEIAGYHYHTEKVMEKFREVLQKNEGTEKYTKLEISALEILSSFERLTPLPSLPARVIHGDLKINNVLFDEKGEKAIALIDLDTLMRGNIAIEMGDALRSWCMPGGEDAPEVRFSREVYEVALAGYFSTAPFLTKEEKKSIPLGVKIITLDLAARFITDAFEESYFALDSAKYPSLFEQCKKRGENQLAFFKEFSKFFNKPSWC